LYARVSPAVRALLRRHLDHQPARLGTWFTPLFHWIVGVVALATVVALAVAHVRALHEARAARQEACVARLETWSLRNPVVARTLPPHQDACAALALVEGAGVTRR
jgi:hypothetical protein